MEIETTQAASGSIAMQLEGGASVTRQPMSPDADITERGQGRIIEGGRAREVNRSEGEMVQHVHRHNQGNKPFNSP
jgi:hypothetical protein